MNTGRLVFTIHCTLYTAFRDSYQSSIVAKINQRSEPSGNLRGGDTASNNVGVDGNIVDLLVQCICNFGISNGGHFFVHGLGR